MLTFSITELDCTYHPWLPIPCTNWIIALLTKEISFIVQCQDSGRNLWSGLYLRTAGIMRDSLRQTPGCCPHLYLHLLGWMAATEHIVLKAFLIMCPVQYEFVHKDASARMLGDMHAMCSSPLVGA